MTYNHKEFAKAALRSVAVAGQSFAATRNLSRARVSWFNENSHEFAPDAAATLAGQNLGMILFDVMKLSSVTAEAALIAAGMLLVMVGKTVDDSNEASEEGNLSALMLVATCLGREESQTDLEYEDTGDADGFDEDTLPDAEAAGESVGEFVDEEAPDVGSGIHRLGSVTESVETVKSEDEE